MRESLPGAGAGVYTPLALTFSFLWASAFIAVKIGLESSPPLFLMGFRFVIAGAALVLFARLRGHVLPSSGRAWVHLGVLGLLNQALYLGLTAVAMQSLAGSTGAILASTNPLLVAMVAAVFLHEQLGPMKILGLLLAFGSVVVIMAARVGIGDAPPAMALVLLANLCMVAGTILFKRWAPQGSLAMVNGIQLVVASVVLLILSAAWESPLATVRWEPSFLFSMAYLVVGLSWGAMLIWFFLLRSGEASRASAFLFLNPVFGLFLGALLRGESLRPIDFAGTAGVALGIYLVQRAR